MTDLVDRLRAVEWPHEDWPGNKWKNSTATSLLCAEAADEIERLRAALREIEDSSNDPRAVREARAALGGKP